MQIGGATISGGFSGEGFAGSIADVSVWNAALSQSQIQTTNFTALTGSEANLAAYYPLNDGSGSTVTDVANHPAGDLQLTFGSATANDQPDWTPTQTAENTALTLDSIGVSDPAAGSNSIQVQLAVDHGSLALNNSSGITLSFDAAHDIATLTGTAANIDTALANGVVYTPASGFTGNDTLTVIANDLGNNSTGSAATGSQTIDLHVGAGPVIDTSHFTVTSNTDGTTTVSGLQVDDGNSAALTQDFTISATTGDVGVTSVTPSAPDTDTLANINSLLNSGIVYHPGANPPAQDSVTLTVTDALGNSDAVHFVFNENGSGSGSQLTGTPGNDVIFATGQPDTLTGNGGQDQFVFKPSDAGQTTTVEHTITDFNVHLDTIDLRQFDISSVASIIASATPGNDTVLTLDDHQTLLLKGVTASSLHASDFIVTPHTV